MESADFALIQGEVDMGNGRAGIAGCRGDRLIGSEYLTEPTAFGMFNEISWLHYHLADWMEFKKFSHHPCAQGV